MASHKSKSRKKPKRANPRPEPAQPARALKVAADANPAMTKPRIVANEPLEDSAVFASASREQLSESLRAECATTMEALELVQVGQFEQASLRLKDIPRSSPYADWRLFIRGLCAFYGSDFHAARQNWQRLDANRRPARIAATLLKAELDEPLGINSNCPPKRVEATRLLLHRSPAIEAAKGIVAVKHRDPEMRFSASQAGMLKTFRDDFRKLDKDFVESFSQACVLHAGQQSYFDVFLMLKKYVPGPAHDPSWNLLEFILLTRFEDAQQELRKTAERYIKNDVPRLTQFSKELTNAIISYLHCILAKEELQANANKFIFFRPPNFSQIEKDLAAAIKAYPAHLDAHIALIDCLNSQLERPWQKTAKQVEAIEARLIKAKESLVKEFPGDVETSLSLIDYYFDENELDKAQALANQLTMQRLESPMAKALPWKISLRKAMYFSRTQAGVPAARQALDIAEAEWPSWISRNWLPFLRAALELRVGNRERYESLSELARKSAEVTQVAGDFMNFAAIQQMNVPSPVLKPFRDVISTYVAQADSLDLLDLVGIGSFFWDLTRTGLRHKGYRAQSPKLGKALCDKFNRLPTCDAMERRFADACCWCADFGFGKTRENFQFTTWAAAIAATEIKVAEAAIAFLLKGSYVKHIVTANRKWADLIAESAKTEKDPFYRYRFEQTAAQAQELIGEDKSDFEPNYSRFSEMLDDDDDEVWDDERAPCDCPDCVAERAREAASNAGNSRTKKSHKQSQANSSADPLPAFLEYDKDTDDTAPEVLGDDDVESTERNRFESQNAASSGGDADSFAPPEIIIKVYTRLGPAGVTKMLDILKRAEHEMNFRGSEFDPIALLLPLFLKNGLTRADLEKTADFIANGAAAEGCSDLQSLDAGPTPTPMTPEERRAADKQRRRELEKKKKQRR